MRPRSTFVWTLELPILLDQTFRPVLLQKLASGVEIAEGRILLFQFRVEWVSGFRNYLEDFRVGVFEAGLSSSKYKYRTINTSILPPRYRPVLERMGREHDEPQRRDEVCEVRISRRESPS